MAGFGKGKGATMRDVARLAGVSTATVSLAMNHSPRISAEVRARVLAAVERIGYAPDSAARTLRRGVAQAIGLIVSDIANPFFAAVAHAVERAAQAAGYAVFICNTDEQPDQEQTHLRLMRAQRAAGVILATAGGGDAVHAQRLQADVAVPAVLIDRLVPGLDWDSVTIDNAAASHAAVAHLVALGHRRIGYVGGLPHLYIAGERLAGYRRALAEGGIAFEAGLVRQGNYRAEQAAEQARALLARDDRPTAMFASNSVAMLGTMQAIAGLRLPYPAAVSVAGVDDMPWATALDPGLTAVAQPASEIGAAAVALLLGRIAEPERTARRLVLPTRLIVRGSTAPPR